MTKPVVQVQATGRHSDLVGTAAAAAYLGVTPRTLEVWRSTQRHPIPYVKVGRLVRYSIKDLDEWLTARRVERAGVGE